MPHAIIEEPTALLTRPSHRKPKTKNPNNKGQHLHSLLSSAQSLYATSSYRASLSRSLISTLKSTKTPITRIISLGLGSLSSNAKGQSRRIKQLAILLALQSELEQTNGGRGVELYAQDPVFTRQDEAFLSSLGIRILRTESGASLGEAASMLSANTLVYSPFLTLEAYEALFSTQSSQLQVFVSDDFNALKEKWPKYSAERVQVERLVKGAVGRYRRRAVGGEGFWEEDDQGFPMAVYGVERVFRERARM